MYYEYRICIGSRFLAQVSCALLVLVVVTRLRHALSRWINDELKDFKPMPVALMAGLLLHAMARMPAGGSCSSHFAAVPLLPPSTPGTLLSPPLVALPLPCLCRTSWSSSRARGFVEAHAAVAFRLAILLRALRRTWLPPSGSPSMCE